MGRQTYWGVCVCACVRRYMCYCGKLQDPPADPWLAPHSCGSVCQKELKPTCGHACLLLCHPGNHTHSPSLARNDVDRSHLIRVVLCLGVFRSLSSLSKDGVRLLYVWRS